MRAGAAGATAAGVGGTPARGRRPERGDPVVDRAFALLSAFDEGHRRLSLTDLARRSGLPLSTARRLALRLVEWGALERDQKGGYAVGLRLWEIGSLAERGPSLRDVAGPFLDDLTLATRQHLQLAVLDGAHAVVVDRRDGAVALPVHYRVGGHLPLVATAVGHVLLAFAPPDLVDEVLGGPFTWPLHECPRPGAPDVRAQLAQTRRTGLALLRRPTSPVTSVATVVRDRDGRAVAALGAVLPAGAGAGALRRLEPALVAAGRGISRRLGAPAPTLPPWDA